MTHGMIGKPATPSPEKISATVYHQGTEGDVVFYPLPHGLVLDAEEARMLGEYLIKGR